MNVIKKLVFTIGIILSATNILLGTEVFAEYYKNDITPPWGRIYIEGAAERNGTTYVTDTALNLKIYAKDDMCKDEEIKYYMSTTPISDTSKLDDNLWKTYVAGETVELTLNEDGTKQIYAIFKDANGNTSLIYEANTNTTQEIIFNANGGTKAPTGANTNRILGMSYIIPNQEPYKSGYKFLGWSTDSEASVASYKAGDAVPPDASLGNEESAILYAIYGSDLSEYPDLIDVVEIGDYVNYPVGYDNVPTLEDDTTVHVAITSSLNGWRVLSGDKETGEVTLISAGIPLSLFKGVDTIAQTIESQMSSTTEFLNIGFTDNQTDGKFRKNGFDGYSTLIEAFTNKYTVINSGIPEVRAMTKNDLDSIYQYFGETGITQVDTVVNDAKFKNMLAIPSITEGANCYYWLATAYTDGTSMWRVGAFGNELNFNEGGYTMGVRPVVTLKANIKAIGQDIDGAWNITTDDEIIRKPEIKKGRFAYNGNEQTLLLKNLNTDKMEITGTTKATDVGTYTVTINLKDTSKTTWTDGTTDPITLEWKIADKLIDIVEVGDYVAYTPDAKTYTTNSSNTGAESITLETDTSAKWRVIDIIEDTREIVVATEGVTHSEGITLNGVAGYTKGPQELHNISAALYSNSELSVTAESMTVEELNEALDITEPSTVDESGYYGTKYAYYTSSVSGTIDGYTKTQHEKTYYSGWTEPRFYTWDDNNGNTMTSTNESTYKALTSSEPVKVTWTYYTYNMNNLKTANSDMISKIFGTSYCWLASSCVDLYSTAEINNMFFIDNSTVNATMLLGSNGTSKSPVRGLCPIIILDSTFKVTGEDLNGAWNIGK